jgi:hypothetical protein
MESVNERLSPSLVEFEAISGEAIIVSCSPFFKGRSIEPPNLVLPKSSAGSSRSRLSIAAWMRA